MSCNQPRLIELSGQGISLPRECNHQRLLCSQPFRHFARVIGILRLHRHVWTKASAALPGEALHNEVCDHDWLPARYCVRHPDSLFRTQQERIRLGEMIRRTAAAAAFISISCFSISAAASPVTLTETQQQTVRDSILAMLRDPDSARFSELSAAAQPTGETVVCGMVNAKNGLGGYIGAMPFSGKLYQDGNFYLTKLVEVGTEARNLMLLCESLGAKIVK